MNEQNIDTSHLKNQVFFFGHQSVGQNIMEGVAEIAGDMPIFTTPPQNSSEGIYHSYIGENGQPFAKINEFTEMVKSIPDDVETTAFLKFCYLDIDETTDVDQIFEYYNEEIKKLQKEKSNVKIIHVTAPLMARQRGLKAVAKRILGKNVNGTEDNLKRYEYNQLIRNNFPGNYFDLAKLESTRPDGTRLINDSSNTPYEVLYDGYTDDGSHLNEDGSKYMAAKFIEFLSNQ